MGFPVESYSFLPGSRAILDLSYRSRLRNSNYAMSQQSIPTISMFNAILTVNDNDVPIYFRFLGLVTRRSSDKCI